MSGPVFTRVALSDLNEGALKDIRVLDLSRLVAGNTLTMTLADLGADVIKVESIDGDTLREWQVKGIATAWKTYSRNKRSISLNLRDATARDILLKLVSKANVFVESYRPGTLEAMGLAPSTLLEINPHLVIVRISGWGQDGPYAARPGFGTLVEGMSGFASMNGFADREPVLPPIYLADMTAGLYGAIGVLTALRNVEMGDGKGQVIDLALLDPLFSILGAQAANYRLTGKVKPRTGSCSTNSAPRNTYQTADGKWVCLSASTQSMTEKLFHAIGRPELITDDRFATNSQRLQNVSALNRILSVYIGDLSQSECLAVFQQAGVTVAPIYDMSDIELDPHYHERDIIVELPDADMGTVPVHAISPRLSHTPGSFRRSAPLLGEHTKEVLHELGLSDLEVNGLENSGVVRCATDEGEV
jgi:crotonobetainyl-CoA:carnitine CoA-transferase CaiB-like acyl-CoA transferase